MKTDPETPSSIRELAAVLSQPKPMRRGSVSERTMKCGKSKLPLPTGSQSAPWPLLQFDPADGWQDAVPLSKSGTGRVGAGANRARS